MNKELAIQIQSYLNGQKENMIQFLSDLVMHETPSTVKSSHTHAQQFLTDKLSDLNFSVKKIKGINTGGHLYARPKTRIKSKPVQLLVGHSDTVWPVNTIKEMSLSVDENKIKGPGVYDMKAGLTQIMFALQALAELNIEDTFTPIIFINSDEEIGSRESTKYIKWLAQCAKRAFILEPPLGLEGKLKTARKGIGRFTIEVQGKAAHAGLDPTKGASAILELSHQIQSLFAMNDHKNGISVNVGLIEGGERANVIAPVSKAVIDVRVLTMKDAELITNKIKSLKSTNSSVTLSIDGAFGRLPMEYNEKNKSLFEIAKQQGELIGLNLEPGTAGGGSDGNTTSLYTPTLDGLGTTGDGAHALHEFAYTDQLVERTILLSLLLIANH